MITMPQPDFSAKIGSVELPNCVLTASGTSGYGAELADYFDLSLLGAVVVKSLTWKPWEGNPPPRIYPLRVGMLNNIGLAGVGIENWKRDYLPALMDSGARVVVSIWGQTVEDFAKTASMISALPPAVVAVEVNLSCPNLGDEHKLFAQSPLETAKVLKACATAERPLWAKLTTQVTDISEVGGAAIDCGAEALSVANTIPAMAVDLSRLGTPLTFKPPVSSAGAVFKGGLSGPAVFPVALRAVYELRKSFPDIGIIGVGGVTSAKEACAFLVAGANAVQVGTATFVDPKAPLKVLKGVYKWYRKNHPDY